MLRRRDIMGYKIFDTEPEARQYSHAEALSRGHGMKASIIQYWWEWRETIDGKWAVQCPDGTEAEPEWKTMEEQ